MGSSIAVQQREKEVQSLKSFLAFSLLGSLGLHIGLLASGIGNFLSRTPDLEDEPMEVVVVDPPKVEEIKLQPQPQQKQPQLSNAPVGTGGSSRLGGYSGSSGGGGTVVRTPSAPITPRISQPAPRIAPSRVVVAQERKNWGVASPPPIFSKTQPAPPAPKVTQATQKVENFKQPAPTIAATPKPVQTAPPTVPNQQLRNTLGNLRTVRESQAPTSPVPSTQPRGTGNNGTGNLAALSRTGTGTGTVSGTGTGSSGTGTGSGNGYGRGSGTGTGTSNGSNQGTPQGRGSGTGDREGTGSGRLACRECGKPKYPEKARRTGVEGSTKVKLEVDDKGNVTDVKVAQSSGNDDLDKEAVRAARRWKLKNPKGGTQGVVAKVDFALEGSQRARRAEERRKRRQARRKRQQEAASSSQRPTQATAPRQQQQQAQPNNSQPAVSDSQSKLRRALRRQGGE